MNLQGEQVQQSGVEKDSHAYFVFLGMAAVGFVGVVVFVVLFGLAGDQWTVAVDYAATKRTFAAGQQMEAAGNFELAAVKYRQALRGKFEEPQQRELCRRALELLQERLRKMDDAR